VRAPVFPTTIPAPITLLCLENTYNIGGGSIWPLSQLQAVTAAGRAAGIHLHLDGARLWHATAKTGIAEATYAAPFDSISVCFSKALGRRSALAYWERRPSLIAQGDSNSKLAVAFAMQASLRPAPYMPLKSIAAAWVKSTNWRGILPRAFVGSTP
jgi:hypothetical protein